MKKLLIVESPAKIKTISKFLGNTYKIMSTMGHIKDLPPKKLGVHINKVIDIDYEVMDGKQKVITDICKHAQGADEVYLAPDPDREGEIIAWHIGQEIEKVIKDKKSMHRITFNEITKDAIEQAIKKKSVVDMEKVGAQQARRVLDRWVGYEVSPVLWRKVAKGLSAGRVQSVVLKLICIRDQEIKDFVSQEYWSIEGIFAHLKEKFVAQLTHINKKKIDLKNKKAADTVLQELPKLSFTIDTIIDKQRTKKPLAPFMTSTLQQAAYNRLGLSVKQTMMVAQKLYEGVPLEDPQSPTALITYMRTDSLRLSETAIKQGRTYVETQFGREYLPTKAHIFAKKTKGQDAHEAIRPIDVTITPEYVKKYVSADQAKLYELIWKRFVACQMKPAVYAQRQVVIIGGKYTFKITGSTLLFDGYLKVYQTDDEDEKEQKVKIPNSLKEKESVTLKKTDAKQHFTQPPHRYTEASLVKEMEKEGIGRPSTYTSILNTIRARQYTELDSKKRFVPTALGKTVVTLLDENLPKIMNIKFTAEMEEDLDKIAEGSLKRDKLLKEFYTDFSKALDVFKEKKITKPLEKIGKKCPTCKKDELVIRTGRKGEFIGCARYPECDFTSNFTREEDDSITLIKADQPEKLDKICPKCNTHPLRKMIGRFGPFVSCSGYPECKYIQQDKAHFSCPLDNADILKKAAKGKTIWGCASYPKCKFVIFNDIEKKSCPQCKAPFLVKKFQKDKTVKLVCHTQECDYQE